MKNSGKYFCPWKLWLLKVQLNPDNLTRFWFHLWSEIYNKTNVLGMTCKYCTTLLCVHTVYHKSTQRVWKWDCYRYYSRDELKEFYHTFNIEIAEQSLNCTQGEINYIWKFHYHNASKQLHSGRGMDKYPIVISLTSYCELAVELRVHFFVSLVAAYFIDSLSYHCYS